ncbi:MAG: tRNA lysidine(34) synthetase TilS [Reinekea sp.]|jgi:tRNA(Ile)-lysidine synthase
MNVLHDLHTDLINTLRATPLSSVFVGYSGGVDSTLLLTLACQAYGSGAVTAIHVHHGLSVNADHWRQHCQQTADRLGCQFIARNVQVQSAGQGLEAEARRQRYEVFKEILAEKAVLLLGQHLDDQVETFFLRLLRGAGVHGLKSMSGDMRRDHYRIIRPLLSISREQIEQLAGFLSLQWIDDESNQDQRMDRNYLRQAVLPMIEQRWPAYRDRILQTIDLLAKPSEKQSDFNVTTELKHRLSHDKGLKLVQIDTFSNAQMLSLLHQWLTTLGHPVPSRQRLQAVLDHIINASPDAQPLVELGGGSIRRHGPALYWVAPMPDVSEPPPLIVNQWMNWSGVGNVCLQSATGDQPRINGSLTDLHWQVRQGGEVMRPYGRSKRRDLKRLFQEYRIKPWLRDRVPLLFSGEDLIAAGDELISADHLAENNQPGFSIQWRGPEISV